jgi:SAM-dependent methyltransferase
MGKPMTMRVADVEEWLDRLYIAAQGAKLRREDRKKAAEVAGFLDEMARALPSRGARTLVDAACGKGYLGVLAAKLLWGTGEGRHTPVLSVQVVAIDHLPARLAAASQAAERLGLAGAGFEARCGEVSDLTLWPAAPDLVVALHACGAAADAVLDSAVRARARRILVAPCCTGARAAAAATAAALGEELGLPRQAAVRRGFVESIVAAERTLRLEAAGYETEVVSFVAPAVTPYHLLWRARRVGEPNRMRDAAERLARLTGLGRVAVTPPL